MDNSTLDFGEWLPDLPDLQNPGLTEAKNVLPGTKSYLPLKSVSQITDAVDSTCKGAATVRDKTGNVYNFAGDTSKLYSLSNNIHSNVTRSSGGNYSVAEDENWEFCKFGETVIATCINDNPQAITLGASNFADLAGSPPKARHCAVINNFVVLANLNDGSSKPNDVRWCAINDPTSWTANADTQSDSQTLHSDANYGGGWIMSIKGGEFGSVFQEYSIWRMVYEGSPTIFSFNEVLPGIGTPCKNSVTQEGRIIHFLSQDGFCQLIDGVQIKAIGKNRVDATFFNDFDATYPEKVIGASDPNQPYVFWIYPGAGNVNGQPNKIIIYDWYNDKWSHAEDILEWVYSAIGQGYTLEGLDAVNASIDDLSPSLDSRAWMGGALQLSVYDDENKKGTFGGTAMSGVIETPEAQFIKGSRAYLSGVRPLIDGESTVQVGTRNKLKDAKTWSSAVSPHSETDIANLRSDARYHTVRVNTSGDFTHIQGIDVFAKKSGSR